MNCNLKNGLQNGKKDRITIREYRLIQLGDHRILRIHWVLRQRARCPFPYFKVADVMRVTP